MGWEACQLQVQTAISSAPGVLRCVADWRKGTATVWMKSESTGSRAALPPLNVSMLSDTFAKGEYTLRLASKPGRASEQAPPSAASDAYAYVSALMFGYANTWFTSLMSLTSSFN